MLAQLNDCIGGLLHLGPNVITFRALLHLGPNVIIFRTLLHLGQLLHLGLQQHKHIDFDLTLLKLLISVIIILYVPFSENYVKLFGYRA